MKFNLPFLKISEQFVDKITKQYLFSQQKESIYLRVNYRTLFLNESRNQIKEFYDRQGNQIIFKITSTSQKTNLFHLQGNKEDKLNYQVFFFFVASLQYMDELEERMKMILAPECKSCSKDFQTSLKLEENEIDFMSQDSIVQQKSKRIPLIHSNSPQIEEIEKKDSFTINSNSGEMKLKEQEFQKSCTNQKKEVHTQIQIIRQQTGQTQGFGNTNSQPSSQVIQGQSLSLQQSSQQKNNIFSQSKKEIDVSQDLEFQLGKSPHQRSKLSLIVAVQQAIGSSHDRSRQESIGHPLASYLPLTVPNTSPVPNSFPQGMIPLNFTSQMNIKSQQLHIQHPNSAIANIKLIAQTRRRIIYFFKKFTASGRREYLAKGEVRRRLEDKSDIPPSRESNFFMRTITAFTNLIFDRHENEEEGEGKYLLNPHQYFSQFFLFLITVFNSIFFLIFSIFIIYRGSDESDNNTRRAVIVIWIVETIMQINTKFYRGSQLVADRLLIIANYVRTRAFFDLVAISLMIIFPDDPIEKTVTQCLTYIKIKNVITDVNKLSKLMCMTFKNYYLLQLINLILKIVLIGHIIACAYYLIGQIELHLLGYEETWYDQGLAQDYTWWKLYLESLYWSLTLLTTGSNVAYTVFQLFFTTFIMLFTTIIFGYLLNVTGAIISQLDAEESSKQLNLNIVNEYMRQNKISKSLQTRVNLDIENYYESNIASQLGQQQALNKISPTLQSQLRLEYCYNILERFSLIKDKFSSQLIEDISMQLEEVYYLPNQVIFQQGQTDGIALQFIIHGSIELSQSPITDPTISRQIGKLYKGQILGALNFFTGVQYDKSVRSKDFTKMVKIDREKFLEIVAKRERDLQVYAEIRDKLMMYENYDQISQKCVFCNSFSHLEFECHLVHIQKDEIYQKVKFFQNLTQERSNIIQRKYIRTKIMFKDLKHQIMSFRKIYKPNKLGRQRRAAINENTFELLDQVLDEEYYDEFDDAYDEEEYEEWREGMKTEFESNCRETLNQIPSEDDFNNFKTKKSEFMSQFKKTSTLKNHHQINEDSEEYLSSSKVIDIPPLGQRVQSINSISNNLNNFGTPKNQHANGAVNNCNLPGSLPNQGSYQQNQQSPIPQNFSSSVYNNNSFYPLSSLTASNKMNQNNISPKHNYHQTNSISNSNSNSSSQANGNTVNLFTSPLGNNTPQTRHLPFQDQQSISNLEFYQDQSNELEHQFLPRKQFRHYTTGRKNIPSLSHQPSSNRKSIPDGQSGNGSTVKKLAPARLSLIPTSFPPQQNGQNNNSSIQIANSSSVLNNNNNNNHNNRVTNNSSFQGQGKQFIQANSALQVGVISGKQRNSHLIENLVKQEDILKQPIFTEWDFESLKDYKFYFPKGNSKCILVKYLKSQRSRMKNVTTKKKQEFKLK